MYLLSQTCFSLRLLRISCCCADSSRRPSPLSHGPPGVSFISENVTIEMMNSTGIMYSKRRMRNSLRARNEPDEAGEGCGETFSTTTLSVARGKVDDP